MDHRIPDRSDLKHCVILCHPDPDSFCAAVADRYCDVVRRHGDHVIVRDLYQMGFDPVLRAAERPTSPDFRLSADVEDELGLIAGTAQFVFIYPLWFGTPPAMLKGYVERVLGAGFSHRAVRDQQFHPILSGRNLLSFSSSGSSWAWLNEKAAWVALRHVFDDYLASAFSLARCDHVHFDCIVDGMKPRFVREQLLRAEQEAEKICAQLHHRPGVPEARPQQPMGI
ncbi:NAD(P)H-dependent oxidoreductase [Sphingobium boeckii]|uniref:NAD(P)H dehydrogenase (Quinone) n=1 Tax=Sphingobium boeckii TaxID=1082345 RepID=A0A7W9AJN9_9SPHN|nr:NAD(P)H-dependent oxidoreductase [Sphingobium boeckii]MBB5686664.1 NAD(P)H dehydrogenase (quinone) [Sphingobium boeckii]